MHISADGLRMIKSFEGCRLKAYWDVKGYSIGYGHFGVNKNDVITQAQADKYLKEDIKKYEDYVNKYDPIYHFNQNQFDALVDFTYNCGAGNLKSLTGDGKRTLEQIALKIPAYCKAGGVVLYGLQKRRKAEQDLFTKSVSFQESSPINEAPTSNPKDVYFPAYEGKSGSIVDALKSLDIDSTKAFRKKIAAANGMSDYSGSAAENKKLLSLLKAGQLRKV